MAQLKNLTDAWKNIREFDLRPLREAALRPVKISLVGAIGTGRHTLLDQMRSDPSRPNAVTQTPVVITTPESAASASAALAEETDLIILVLDVTHGECEAEGLRTRTWSEAGKKVLIFVNKLDTLADGSITTDWVGANSARVVYGSALDWVFLQECFVPAVLALLPDQHLALGRQFPMFRQAIARELIDDTCIANAAYALSTGIAEVVPVLDLPFNIADMVVLTKAQAFLVYKLGLTLGFSIDWQDYVAEFGSVIGGGFVWRQLARQLVGLIPVWGIIPKVGVAYAGTFAVGNAVLQWYLTGRHISKEQIRGLYLEAFGRGKQLAQNLLAKAPRIRLIRRKDAQLPGDGAAGTKSRRLKIGLLKRKVLPTPVKTCLKCSRDSARDAVYCQYCGEAFNENDNERV